MAIFFFGSFVVRKDFELSWVEEDISFTSNIDEFADYVFADRIIFHAEPLCLRFLSGEGLALAILYLWSDIEKEKKRGMKNHAQG